MPGLFTQSQQIKSLEGLADSLNRKQAAQIFSAMRTAMETIRTCYPAKDCIQNPHSIEQGSIVAEALTFVTETTETCLRADNDLRSKLDGSVEADLMRAEVDLFIKYLATKEQQYSR
jgi:hypothetical protein